MPKLSVTIITKNEAAHIAPALESVSWADERVVIDSESSDETVAIARRYADRVCSRTWPGYGAQKNHAAESARHDWILSLDADERVTPKLAREIRELLVREPDHSGYRIPRVTSYLGRWIRSTDWYPDYQLRLYDRRVGQFNSRPVHESVDIREPVGTLRHELQHFSYENIADHLVTINRYTTLAAGQMHAQGRQAGVFQLAFHPPFTFLRNYMLRLGFRQGTPGLIVSLMNSYYVFLKFSKLWELRRGGPSNRQT